MINLYIIDNKGWRASEYGVGTYMNELSLVIDKDIINVTFIYLFSPISNKVLSIMENGVNKLHIPSPTLKETNNKKQYECYYKSAIFILKKYINNQNNLIFHLNYFEFFPLLSSLKTYFNCKIILAIHFLSWSFSLNGNAKRFKNIIKQKIPILNNFEKKIKDSFNMDKEFLDCVDIVLCLSKNTANIIHKMYKIENRKIIIIYNGLTDRNQKIVNKELLRRKLNIPLQTPVVIYVGRLDPIKGLSYLIKASKIVLEHYPNCHFVIAGSGDYDTYMKECNNKWMNIHFTGLLEKSDLYELYSIADFGIIPSLHEQCSYVAIEMMMHGLPIIASTSTGLSEMIKENTNGLHIPVIEFDDKVDIDVELLAEKMIFMLENEMERKKMGINSRKRYEKLYSSKIMGEKMIRLYFNLFK